MPRAPRLQPPNGIYHVTARGNRRAPIFVSDRDRRLFLRMLGKVVRELRWRCHAFCLMPNHYHVVVRTPNPDLSAGMHRLNGPYARWFNAHYGFEGHVFQGRFHAVVVESDWHLLELSRYLALNPVRAGLCRHAWEWPWSSYRGTVGLDLAPDFLAVDDVLGHFGPSRARAREVYREFVGAQQDMPI